MYELVYTKQMERDYKRMKKRGADMSKLIQVTNLLQAGQPLPRKYRDHPLKGKWGSCRDCHIEDDWILIYQVDNGALKLIAIRTGAHSDLQL
jgi:mRNA interferase YafQ